MNPTYHLEFCWLQLHEKRKNDLPFEHLNRGHSPLPPPAKQINKQLLRPGSTPPGVSTAPQSAWLMSVLRALFCVVTG